MEYSNTLRLNEPEDGDGFDIGHFNENSESLDNIIGGDIASIASAEASSTATKAHAVGSYLTMGGKLYRVTSAIAIGDTISTSTNVTETSLLNEINTLQEFAGNLESSIAPVESTTATTNHAVGDYFMLGNVLMRATAAIATGEQITTSNATPATVQSQIDTLRDSVSTASGTGTRNTAITVNAECNWRRIGKLVLVDGWAKMSVDFAAWSGEKTLFSGLPRSSFSPRTPVTMDNKGARESTVIISTAGDLILNLRAATIVTGDVIWFHNVYMMQ